MDVAVLSERVALTKERLRLYPLFSEDFLNWLFERIDPSCSPIYTTHFRMRKPA